MNISAARRSRNRNGARLSQPQRVRTSLLSKISKRFGLRRRCGWDSRAPIVPHQAELELRAPSPIGARSGFSLVEVIGVLAIIAVLAALLLPSQIKRIDMATRAKEVTNLGAIREALVHSVIRSRSIPDESGWLQAAADRSLFPISQVATNARRYQRLYFLPTTLTPGLSYSQTNNGTNQPDNLRAIVISILGGDPLSSANCPNPNGGTLSDADFNALWSVPEGGRPTTGAWANWNGRGDDFLAERINYAPLFHRLVLVNRDSNSPAFRINGSSPVAVINNPSNNVGWTAYYLDGSVLSLCDTDADATTKTRYVLKRDIGFVFEKGMWRAEIMGLVTGNSQADDFGNKAAGFLAAEWYSGSAKGADQQSALIAMYSFMYTYTLWANQCPHFPYHNIPSQQQVPEYMLLQSAVGDADNAGLDDITGEGGLLDK